MIDLHLRVGVTLDPLLHHTGNDQNVHAQVAPSTHHELSGFRITQSRQLRFLHREGKATGDLYECAGGFLSMRKGRKNKARRLVKQRRVAPQAVPYLESVVVALAETT